MNRINARIMMFYELADASRQYIAFDDKLIPPDRELYKRAVAENHAYCDIRDAIRAPGRRAV